MIERYKELKLSDNNCLYTYDEVVTAVQCQAVAINQHYGDQHCVILSIMRGGIVYSGLLLPHLSMPALIDYIHVSRYHNGTEGKTLHWKVTPEIDITQKHVLLLDDIFDRGVTLSEVKKYCVEHGAKSVMSAVMLLKDLNEAPSLFGSPDFYALSCEDKYVFGMGMDYHGYHRNANGIYFVGE